MGAAASCVFFESGGFAVATAIAAGRNYLEARTLLERCFCAYWLCLDFVRGSAAMSVVTDRFIRVGTIAGLGGG